MNLIRCKALFGTLIFALGICFLGILASPKFVDAGTNYLEVHSTYMQELSLLDVKITLLNQSAVGTVKVSYNGGAEIEIQLPSADGSFHWTRSGLTLGTDTISVNAYDFGDTLLEERNYLINATGQLVESLPIYGDPIQLSIRNGLARPSAPANYVRTPITVDATTFSTGFNSYSLDINYDPSKVRPTGIVAYISDNKNGIAVPTSIGEITTTDSTHAKVHVQWSGTIPASATYALSKGILFKLIFEAQSEFVSTDVQTAIAITTASFNLNSGTSNNISYNEGIVYFGMYGNVTNDNFITSADTTQILRYSLGKSNTLNSPARLLAADVTGDGFITSADTTQILRYSLGKSNTLNTLFQY